MDFVGIDKFSLLDYDEKVSIVLFSPACNFRCPFCHNGKSVLNSTTYIPFNEILEYLKTRKGVVDAVVITGGEPTLMPELKERIRKIRELGFLIKIDSNGTNPEILEELINLKLIDYIAMDIKNSPGLYPETVGIPTFDITNVEKSKNLLLSGDTNYEFRTTVVAQLHDAASFEAIGPWLAGAERYFLQAFTDRDTVAFSGFSAPSLEETYTVRSSPSTRRIRTACFTTL